MELLLQKIDEKITAHMVRTAFAVPYDKGNILSALCENGQVESMDYTEQATVVRGRFRQEDRGRYREYEVTDGAV